MSLLRFLNALCFMLMTNLRGARVLLSLTHTGGMAAASVVLISG